MLQGRENEVTRVLHIFTEPFMAPGRKIQEKFLPQLPLDFSPLFALLFLQILSSFIAAILRSLGL